MLERSHMVHRVMIDMSGCSLKNGRSRPSKWAAWLLLNGRQGVLADGTNIDVVGSRRKDLVLRSKVGGNGARIDTGSVRVLRGQPALCRLKDPEWQPSAGDSPRVPTSTCLQEEPAERRDEILTCLGTSRAAPNLLLRRIDRQSCLAQQDAEAATGWSVQGWSTSPTHSRLCQREESIR